YRVPGMGRRPGRDEHQLVRPCLPTASMLSAGTPHRPGARRSPSSSTMRETTLQPPQRPAMVPQVVVDEAGDEEVAVVIAGLPPPGQRITRCRRGRFQRLGFELLREKVVRLALIHQQRQALRGGGDQLARIPLLPAYPIIP